MDPYLILYPYKEKKVSINRVVNSSSEKETSKHNGRDNIWFKGT